MKKSFQNNSILVLHFSAKYKKDAYKYDHYNSYSRDRPRIKKQKKKVAIPSASSTSPPISGQTGIKSYCCIGFCISPNIVPKPFLVCSFAKKTIFLNLQKVFSLRSTNRKRLDLDLPRFLHGIGIVMIEIGISESARMLKYTHGSLVVLF